MIIKYWCKKGKIDHSAYEQALETLPELERQKVVRIRNFKQRYTQLMGKILLMEAMIDFGESADLRSLSFGEYGKPYFADSDVAFNISHTDFMVVVLAQKGGAVGVDVEYLRAMSTADFHRVFTQSQIECINGSIDPARSFFHHWTAKEAVSKYLGEGLTTPFKEIEVFEDHAFYKGEQYPLVQPALSSKYLVTYTTGPEA